MRFRFHPNRLSMPVGAKFSLLDTLDKAGSKNFVVLLQRQNGGYYLLANARRDAPDTSSVWIPTAAIGEQATLVEVRYRAALDTPAPSGYLEVWIDGDRKMARQLDNDQRAVASYRLGAEG